MSEYGLGGGGSDKSALTMRLRLLRHLEGGQLIHLSGLLHGGALSHLVHPCAQVRKFGRVRQTHKVSHLSEVRWQHGEERLHPVEEHDVSQAVRIARDVRVAGQLRVHHGEQASHLVAEALDGVVSGGHLLLRHEVEEVAAVGADVGGLEDHPCQHAGASGGLRGQQLGLGDLGEVDDDGGRLPDLDLFSAARVDDGRKLGIGVDGLHTAQIK